MTTVKACGGIRPKIISKFKFIKEMAKQSENISDHMKDVIARSDRHSLLHYFGKCETLEEVEDTANRIEAEAKALLEKIGWKEPW